MFGKNDVRMVSPWATVTLMLLAVRAPAAAEELAYVFDGEEPIAWSDVALDWGRGGFLEWTPADGGKPGNALRITTVNNKAVLCSETRCLQFNHEPGTPVRIRFDVKLVSVPAKGQMRVRYFDGYTTATAFDAVADDEFAPWPEPIWTSAGQSVGHWQHVDFKTPPLEHSVFTLAVMVQDPRHDAKDDPNAVEFVDVLIDNLRVDTTVSTQFRDPGFDWHGQGGRKMIEWRWGTGGAHVDWCDFMQEEDVPAQKGKVIHYRLTTFLDTGAGRPGHAKHDFDHDVANLYVGGLSVIVLSNIHADEGAAAWGVRQTFAYSALGLKPGEPALITIKMKNTVHDPVKRHWAKLLVGCDPRGRILPTTAVWSPETTPNWDEGGFQVQTLQLERPPDAKAMTVYFKMRDGHPHEMKFPDGRWGDDPDSQATKPGCRAFADWVLIKARPVDAGSAGSAK